MARQDASCLALFDVVVSFLARAVAAVEDDSFEPARMLFAAVGCGLSRELWHRALAERLAFLRAPDESRAALCRDSQGCGPSATARGRRRSGAPRRARSPPPPLWEAMPVSSMPRRWG
jgi:hypothetical protein